MEPDELVSVVVPTYNRSRTIKICLEALAAQSHRNIEIIVSDDGSSDETADIVAEFMRSDRRIQLIRSPVNAGPAAARNRAIRKARGKLIFFTDDDVAVPPDWVSKGLRVFRDAGCVGVEGRITYVSETYSPRYSDRVVSNLSGNHFMMANMAYTKDVLFKVGLLNESFRVMEDRDLAMRVQECGDVLFSRDLNVTHMREQRTMRSFFLEARSFAAQAQFNMVHNKRDRMVWFVHQPEKLLTLIFPPLIFVRYFSAKFESPFDYLLLLALYPRLWYERILVWRWAIRYHKFMI
ncbi:MAG: glycosyltransferase family 2 protein [Streptosporangiaceae bacterium]|nr:glycosyltransferase family 2 protein [Streptosporangiaceae bacterium]